MINRKFSHFNHQLWKCSIFLKLKDNMIYFSLCGVRMFHIEESYIIQLNLILLKFQFWKNSLSPNFMVTNKFQCTRIIENMLKKILTKGFIFFFTFVYENQTLFIDVCEKLIRSYTCTFYSKMKFLQKILGKFLLYLDLWNITRLFWFDSFRKYFLGITVCRVTDK